MKARFTIPAKTPGGDETFPLELEREGVGELIVRVGGKTVVASLYQLQQALRGLDFYTDPGPRHIPRPSRDLPR